MDNIGFSIIIPCYNAQRYLGQCLDSVLSQSYTNFEVILINDGSTDKTQDILNAYQERDDRLVVIHKRNQGVSSARNDGLRLARKEYIVFLDSDDFMMNDILSKVASKIAGKDDIDLLIGCNMMHYYEATNSKKFIPNITSDELIGQSKEKIITGTIGNHNTLGIWAVWRHVYRRDLIQQHNLFFDVCYAYAEDMDWLIQVMLASTHFAFMDEPLCYYRFDNELSASNQYSLRHICNHIEILAKWIRYFETVDYEKNNRKQILQRLSNKLMTIPSKINHLDDKQRKVAIRYIEQYQMYLRHVKGLKFKGAYILTRLLGIARTTKILGKVND